MLVSLALARREVPVPFALRLFLPEGWTRDAGRLERAGVPEARRNPRTKPEIALAEIDRAVAARATGQLKSCDQEGQGAQRVFDALVRRARAADDSFLS